MPDIESCVPVESYRFLAQPNKDMDQGKSKKNIVYCTKKSWNHQQGPVSVVFSHSKIASSAISILVLFLLCSIINYLYFNMFLSGVTREFGSIFR